MSAVTKQADSGFGSIELSLPRRESALCNTKSLALCAGQREGYGTQPDSDAIRFDVSDGSKPEKLDASKCFPASPPKADITLRSRYVRFVPQPDLCCPANCTLTRSLVDIRSLIATPVISER